MGTANFYNKNASKIYAGCMSYEDDVLDDEGEPTGEKEMYTPDEFEYNDWIYYVRECLYEIKGYSEEDKWENNYDRNFTGRIIGSVTRSKKFGNMDVSVTIDAISRSGYYEGSNLDWSLSYCYCNDSDDSFNPFDVKSDFIYYSNMNPGMASIQARNACKFMSKTADQLIKEVESVFEKCTTPLVVSARFSNGETWYTKAS
jgi:hypothetical protein